MWSALVVFVMLPVRVGYAGPRALHSPVPVVSECSADVDRDGVTERVILAGAPSGKTGTVMVIDSKTVTVLSSGSMTLSPSETTLVCSPGNILWGMKEGGEAFLSWSWNGAAFVESDPWDEGL